MGLWTAWLHVNLVPQLQNSGGFLRVNPPPTPRSQWALWGSRCFLPPTPLSRETEGKDIRLNAVYLSTKKFPGSTVVLNYLHVSVIFNSGVFLLFSSQKCSVFGEGIQLLGLTFPGVLHRFDGTLWSAEIL